MQPLSEELQKIADKILAGDYLNIPTCNKFDLERLVFYCAGVLNEKIDALEAKIKNPPEKQSTFSKYMKGSSS